jgi:uncharacterized protein (TIGR02145 family)
MNKKNFLIISFLVLGAGFFGFILSSQLSSVLAENELLNPGHLWNELECSETLCVTQNGVGIGTINPDESLHITKKIKVGDSVIYDPSRDASPWLFENFVSVPGPGDGPSHAANKGYVDGLLFDAYEYVDSLSISSSPSELYDARDGNKYSTVQIGDQYWMAENLRYLPNVVPPIGTASETDSYYYVYGYDGITVADAKKTDNYVIHGVLYNWPAAMDDACPEGWHLPTMADWFALKDELGGYNEAGEHLKVNGSSGFNGYLSGYISENSYWNSFGNYARFWSSTLEGTKNLPGYWVLNWFNDSFSNVTISPSCGHSVRCLKNDSI